MAAITASNFKFASQGLLRWLEINWVTSAHYFVLVKSTKTPSQTENAYSNISGHLCNSAGYAHQAAAGKAFLSSANSNAADCDSPNFGDGMLCKYLFLLSGTAGSPQASDRIIGHWDLDTPGTADITVNGPLNIDFQGTARFSFPTW
jgi:hypothetical protein